MCRRPHAIRAFTRRIKAPRLAACGPGRANWKKKATQRMQAPAWPWFFQSQAADNHHGPARRSNRTRRHIRNGTQASARRHAATRGLTIRMSTQSLTAAVAVRPRHEILLRKNVVSPS
jgi:hypothetical protein